MPPYKPSSSIAIIGTGPGALMAADRLAMAGRSVTLFDKRPGIAWKLFVAGSSGLNITHALDSAAFAQQYSGPPSHWEACLKAFSNQDWIRFIEDDLGQKTFLGTSGRYFVEIMHAAKLVKAWKKRLEALGCTFHLSHEWKGFEEAEEGWKLSFDKGRTYSFETVALALGGGSYEPNESPLRWPPILQSKALGLTPFSPMNAGYHIAWPAGFLEEVDGQPFKNVVFQNAKGSRKGDLMVTAYGLEGTPIYTLGEPGPAWIDLKPDLTQDAIEAKLDQSRENLALIRRAQRHLGLNKTALALLFHMAPPSWKNDKKAFAAGIKHFPLTLMEPRPLSESISSRGGLSWGELDEGLQIRSYPKIYALGEMIDWEAPTGGFLIQGAVSQGAFVAASIIRSNN